MVAKKLANHMGGLYMNNPPPCLHRFRESFLEHAILKKAFYSLSMYASAVNVTRQWYNDVVVMAGFWHDQAAYSIARTHQSGIPPKESSIYKWPSDLLRPDVAFFIHSPPPRFSRGAPINHVMRKRLLDVYRNMQDPGLIEISEIYNHDQIRYEMEVELQKMYKADYQKFLKPPKVFSRYGQQQPNPFYPKY
uniref:Uncharacterized protein n=4 Tax=Clastoptera arizonana TaxID=38151 RepID=A0A1B6D8A3_9HEMI